MMRCEDVLEQLNARADGELPAAQATALEAHLAECSNCRGAAETIPAIDAELRDAFVSRRAAAGRLGDRTALMARELANTATGTSPPNVALASAVPESWPAPRWAWAQMLAGLAAGFLLAITWFRPWEKQALAPEVLLPIEPVAHLAIATGPVEVQPAGEIQAFTCPESGPIARDSIVRTGPKAQCELSLQNGNALRLDCNTEVKLHKSKVVEVNRGRLWTCSQPGRGDVEIESAGCRVVAKPSAQLAIDCQPPAARLIVLNGAVNVQTAAQSLEVGPEKQVRLVRGVVQEPTWCDTSVETAWVNSVLALRRSDHPELADRVNRLLANVGAAKLSLMYEDELRRLGDDGVPPLLAYLTTTRDTPNTAQRATAAGIVADVAQPRWIPDLIELLTDPNENVRYCVARGLERLTGRDQGLKPETWQSGPWKSCQAAHQKWLKWWTANRDRYPAARREIPAPRANPF
jgi:hypothetical protein